MICETGDPDLFPELKVVAVSLPRLAPRRDSPRAGRSIQLSAKQADATDSR
jgi:hypothetical protein